eukprot:Plantae.Rhodophyta-Hildenbrandia_rubra.ctg3826.p3 GENE.Plantae.Rhodophyta-Hildenbrandia_rubra.ctg3826~~Plantae.Rhodophyta-Hildenbrandia_rubra.ctg3826.p3  ORF type:complete len:260 (+),score=41.99 Plantae.Rhodophyta-Hildenbrandia_rubra.ctg3826:410-1189(+)
MSPTKPALLRFWHTRFRPALVILLVLAFFLVGYFSGILRGSNYGPAAPSRQLSEEDYKTVYMGKTHVDMVIKYLKPTDLYLEWGSGGSTLIFSRFVGKTYSIEHVPNYCKHIKEQVAKSRLRNVKMYCVTEHYKNGQVIKNEKEGNYNTFQKYVDKIDDLGIAKFDAVLIDGRARLAAALKVLPYLKDSSVVILHDTARREKTIYKDIFDHYDVVEKNDGGRGLAVLRRKQMYSGDAGLPIKREYINHLYKSVDHLPKI